MSGLMSCCANAIVAPPARPRPFLNQLRMHSAENARDAMDDQHSSARVPTDPTTGRRLRGLSWDKKNCLWRVRIYYGGKLRFVGKFADALEGARAYDKAAGFLYGAAGITNFGLTHIPSADEVGACIVEAKKQARQHPYTATALMAQQLQLYQQQDELFFEDAVSLDALPSSTQDVLRAGEQLLPPQQPALLVPAVAANSMSDGSHAASSTGMWMQLPAWHQQQQQQQLPAEQQQQLTPPGLLSPAGSMSSPGTLPVVSAPPPPMTATAALNRALLHNDSNSSCSSRALVRSDSSLSIRQMLARTDSSFSGASGGSSLDSWHLMQQLDSSLSSSSTPSYVLLQQATAQIGQAPCGSQVLVQQPGQAVLHHLPQFQQQQQHQQPHVMVPLAQYLQLQQQQQLQQLQQQQLQQQQQPQQLQLQQPLCMLLAQQQHSSMDGASVMAAGLVQQHGYDLATQQLLPPPPLQQRQQQQLLLVDAAFGNMGGLSTPWVVGEGAASGQQPPGQQPGGNREAMSSPTSPGVTGGLGMQQQPSMFAALGSPA